jgi:hypothetical protein
MPKSTTKQIDQQVAADLGLQLSPFTMTLKHVKGLTKLVHGFVFAFQHDGLVYYDSVDRWTETLGLRHKISRFVSNPQVEERLAKHQYKCWYVHDGQTLYRIQTAKVECLKDHFYFITDATGRHPTQTAGIEETDFIRKKPLMAMRPFVTGWGVRPEPAQAKPAARQTKMALAT